MADLLLGRTETTTDVTVATDDLVTHGFIVGMTGSGKTGLGVGLIEECLNAGVPCLLIDPKGDLTNLCLTFPALSPADFEPWVNPSDVAKAGVPGKRAVGVLLVPRRAAIRGLRGESLPAESGRTAEQRTDHIEHHGAADDADGGRGGGTEKRTT